MGCKWLAQHVWQERPLHCLALNDNAFKGGVSRLAYLAHLHQSLSYISFPQGSSHGFMHRLLMSIPAAFCIKTMILRQNRHYFEPTCLLANSVSLVSKPTVKSSFVSSLSGRTQPEKEHIEGRRDMSRHKGREREREREEEQKRGKPKKKIERDREQ